jgi:hypothetical protein
LDIDWDETPHYWWRVAGYVGLMKEFLRQSFARLILLVYGLNWPKGVSEFLFVILGSDIVIRISRILSEFDQQ